MKTTIIAWLICVCCVSSVIGSDRQFNTQFFNFPKQLPNLPAISVGELVRSPYSWLGCCGITASIIGCIAWHSRTQQVSQVHKNNGLSVDDNNKEIINRLLPYAYCAYNHNNFGGRDHLLTVAAHDANIIKYLPEIEHIEDRINHLKTEYWSKIETQIKTPNGVVICMEQVLKDLLPQLLAPAAQQMDAEQSKQLRATRNQTESAREDGDILSVTHQWEGNPESWHKEWIKKGLLQLIKNSKDIASDNLDSAEKTLLFQVLAKNCVKPTVGTITDKACEYVYANNFAYTIWEQAQGVAVENQRIEPLEKLTQDVGYEETGHAFKYSVNSVDNIRPTDFFQRPEFAAIHTTGYTHEAFFNDTQLTLSFIKEHGLVKNYSLTKLVDSKDMRWMDAGTYHEASVQVQDINRFLINRYCFDNLKKLNIELSNQSVVTKFSWSFNPFAWLFKLFSTASTEHTE